MPDLEVEVELLCGEVAARRSRCVAKESCEDVRRTFGREKDRATEVWTCFLACGGG